MVSSRVVESRLVSQLAGVWGRGQNKQSVTTSLNRIIPVVPRRCLLLSSNLVVFPNSPKVLKTGPTNYSQKSTYSGQVLLTLFVNETVIHLRLRPSVPFTFFVLSFYPKFISLFYLEVFD